MILNLSKKVFINGPPYSKRQDGGIMAGILDAVVEYRPLQS